MVRVYREDILPKILAAQPGKRMPRLCSVNRSFGWRIVSENYEEHSKGMRSEFFDINEGTGTKEDYLTSMAISDEIGVVAISSGSRDGTLHFIKDMSAIKDTKSGPRFKPLHKETLETPIHSIDWSGKHLLVGTNKGITKLYKIEYEDSIFNFTCLGEYINPPSEISIHAPSYIVNTHVKSAEFSPNYFSDFVDTSRSGTLTETATIQSHFLTTTINQISIWDAIQEAAPVNRMQASKSLLNCASWSPNDPQSLIVCGGYEQKLSIFDTRVSPNENNGVVWSVNNAHDRPIRDAKFNPFIPYWLASAGEDSTVNIWDIRSSYHAPVAKIDGMIGMATSVTWSNIRPENLGTSSTDGIMRYWTLSPESFPLWDTRYRIANFDKQDTLPITREFEPDNIWCVKNERYKTRATTTSWAADGDEGIVHEKMRSTMLLAGANGLGEWGRPEPGTIYKGEEIVYAKGAVVSVKPSKLRPSMYYCITNGGQLASHTVRFDAASNLRNRHRFDPKDKNEIAEIEDDIYCRRITEARRKLEILKTTPQADQYDEDQRVEEVTFLEDCLKIRDPIKSTDWLFDSIPDKSSRRVSRRLWNGEDKWEMAIHKFKTELKYWSYRIPPGYNTGYKFGLEFNDPIIAPHLLKEEVVPMELPPFEDDAKSTILSVPDDMSFEPLYSPKENDLTHHDDDNLPSILLTKTTSIEDHRVEAECSAPRPLKDRRNMSHVPPIVTVQDTDSSPDQAQTTQQSSANPFTPPFSAITAANNQFAEHDISQAVMTNTNPFETDTFARPQDSPTKTPHSTNSFEISSPQVETHPASAEARSTNPFVFDSTPDNEDRHSTHSNEENGHKKRRSWIRSGHHLTESLSRHSEPGFDEPKTPTKHHHRFNPFKRILSRRGSTEDEEEEEAEQQKLRLPSTELQRKPSDRRNALHGPF